MRDFCAMHRSALRPREADFIDDLEGWRGRLSEKQQAWLTAIYARLQRGAP
jgi:hypothetical protein